MAQDQPYQGAFPLDVWLDDDLLRVTVHFALVEGQLTCVGLDIHAFTSPDGFRPPKNAERKVVPIGGDYVKITSPLIRKLRVAEMVEAAMEQARGVMTRILEDWGPELGSVGDSNWQRMFGEQPRKRGPKPVLDDAALRDVVAVAYRSAASKPVQAVRRAMAEQVPFYKGTVTPDQARKAVVAARARGFIPPAKRSGK